MCFAPSVNMTCGLTSFGFDHNFDHNAKDFIWSIAGTPALIECLRRLA